MEDIKDDPQNIKVSTTPKNISNYRVGPLLLLLLALIIFVAGILYYSINKTKR